MSAPSLARRVRALALGASLLLAGTLLAAPAQAHPAASAAAEGAQRANTNPTGTASGSLPNGARYLKLSLAATSDGRIRVSWVRPGRLTQFRRFVVQVSPSRQMVTQKRSYRVNRRRQALVVPHAAGASPASGNYSFVRVVAFRRGGARSSSPAKWIQAPILSPCTAAAADQVTVAAFNVRTWAADRAARSRLSWNFRGKNVISEILRSGAHAIAIQEASGRPFQGFGRKPQERWIIDRLNAVDPDRSARWVDALPETAYRPPRGRKPGHVGTRVFYDASKYRELASGLARIVDPGTDKDSLVPWARLQSVAGNQAPFVLTSNHLQLGVARSLRDWRVRARQTVRTISVLRELQSRFGDQVILAGDLNSTANTRPYNNVHQRLMRAGFYDAYASRRISGGKFPTTSDSTFPVYRTPLRRDYILTLGPVKGSCAYRNQIYNRRSRIASDHFLQVARVPLPAL